MKCRCPFDARKDVRHQIEVFGGSENIDRKDQCLKPCLILGGQLNLQSKLATF